MLKRLKLSGNLFKKVAKNSGWLVFQNIFTMLVGVIVTGIVARYFGTEKYGIFSYVLSITSLFTGIATVGINHIVVKDLTQQPENEGKIIGTSFIIRIISAIVLTIVSEITVVLLVKKDITSIIIGLFLSLMMLFNSAQVIEYYLQANMKAKYQAISTIIAFVFLSTLKILTVIFKLDIHYYALTYLLETVVYAMLLIVSYRIIQNKKESKSIWKFDKAYAKKLLSKAWYFALSSIMVTIYMRIDQVMLGAMIVDKSQVRNIFSSC